MQDRYAVCATLALLMLITVVPAQRAAAAADANTVIVRDFEDDAYWSEWLDVRAADRANTQPTRGFLGAGLAVTVPSRTHRGLGTLDRLAEPTSEAWFRYMIRLDEWQAEFRGKLPGLSGVYGASAKGCIPSTPDDPGWSARTVFEATASSGAGEDQVRLGTYLYHLGQSGPCGDIILWTPGVIDVGRWYCVEGHVRLNTPGSPDGVVEAWLDGSLVMRQSGLAMRRATEPNVMIRDLWHNVYFGGSVTNPTDLRLVLDQVVVSTDRRVGCLDPFLDDQDSPHEAALTELHALSIIFGCGRRTVCPDRFLTRAEVAALLTRSLSLPPGPNPFVDAADHWASSAIGSIAAAGLTRGCDPPDNRHFCPDAVITRAQMAVFIDRAFGLAEGADAFTDDDGSFAESAINALARAGITRGCNPPANDRYCPGLPIPRDQAATILTRALGAPPPGVPNQALSSAIDIGVKTAAGFGWGEGD